MTEAQLQHRFRALCGEELPRLGGGLTAKRFLRIFDVGREDLSLAKLVEAHWDAVAILAEAGHTSSPGAIYGVWASERPGTGLSLTRNDMGSFVHGRKAFCSGAGLVDRALVSVEGGQLVEIDLRAEPQRLVADETGWQVDAFRMTRTALLTFENYPLVSVVGGPGWYTSRVGFWQGAIGPAAAWAGGAAALVDFAAASPRQDPHSVAHLGDMSAQVWAMKSLLYAVGDEFDQTTQSNLMVRALMVRHLIEQSCTDILKRFARAMGPVPLAMDAEIARRYAELDLFLRQSHAERDLEVLGRALREADHAF